ncbi:MULTISPECIES: protein-export chaperone SecB [Halocynthiibacter]|uniref:Protein-export protein SecB n=1 Tax=Halocynthiibacter halioticoli TaxID=2986804 RepID=A0AAE3J0P2_9RHOB|nr:MULTISPECIES: protein-export chaperone SecB [Halocynthiibacter]MCV6825618.1 protein-export chaperone SecB [Halocynthiibacter halioticoli]MCW4058619.1 protein-export chaperone SecB [Halocynthiibacter sp. SDUM655004]MDE0591009.1 protein-export chaperone SecB [Halocynthiibacter sp. C4]
MTEETNGAAEPKAAAAPSQPVMQVLAQFVRDLSFENIVAQKGITNAAQPDVQVQVNLDAKKRSVENQYEVIMKLKVVSNIKDTQDPMFLMELEYGGIFHIQNVPDEQMHPFLLIECPRMLFPYVRRIVGDVTRDGGFPPLNLETIDFLALYRSELQRRAQAEAAAQTTPAS